PARGVAVGEGLADAVAASEEISRTPARNAITRLIRPPDRNPPWPIRSPARRRASGSASLDQSLRRGRVSSTTPFPSVRQGRGTPDQPSLCRHGTSDGAAWHDSLGKSNRERTSSRPVQQAYWLSTRRAD